MPTNAKERALFALITVIITVHAYVFYSLYVINGSTLMNLSGADSVIKAINNLGGVYVWPLFADMGSCFSRILFRLFSRNVNRTTFFF